MTKRWFGMIWFNFKSCRICSLEYHRYKIVRETHRCKIVWPHKLSHNLDLIQKGRNPGLMDMKESWFGMVWFSFKSHKICSLENHRYKIARGTHRYKMVRAHKVPYILDPYPERRKPWIRHLSPPPSRTHDPTVSWSERQISQTGPLQAEEEIFRTYSADSANKLIIFN